jgi:hypothetical protein
MKYLIRGNKKNFLETNLENGPKFVLTGKEVSLQDLLYFGTEVMNDSDIKSHAEKMENLGVDYLFVSPIHERVAYEQYAHGIGGGKWISHKELRAVTAYRMKDFY